MNAAEGSAFSVIRMGSRGTFVLCTARSRCMRIDAAERSSGEGPSIDSTSVDRSVSAYDVARALIHFRS